MAKIKILNIISLIIFFLSSVTLLFIPFLNLDEGFPAIGYILAGIFWGGLLCGIIIQIILSLIYKKKSIKTKKKYSKISNIIGIVFMIFFTAVIPVLVFQDKNDYILPINLFAIFFTAELYVTIKKLERLK